MYLRDNSAFKFGFGQDYSIVQTIAQAWKLGCIQSEIAIKGANRSIIKLCKQKIIKMICANVFTKFALCCMMGLVVKRFLVEGIDKSREITSITAFFLDIM